MAENGPPQTAQEPRSGSTRTEAILENRSICTAIAVHSWSLATRNFTRRSGSRLCKNVWRFFQIAQKGQQTPTWFGAAKIRYANFSELIYSEVQFCFYTASVEKRLRPVVPLGRNRVGPLPRNRVVPFRRNQVGPFTRNPASLSVISVRDLLDIYPLCHSADTAASEIK